MTTPRRGSFHDPDGSVYFHANDVLRGLRHEAAVRLSGFLGTPVARKLIEEGLLVDASAGDGPDPALSWFRHPRLPFITYPHEWLPEQIIDAALLTVRLARRLRAHGWDLKDGNLRNVVFHGRQARFVDWGSIVPREPSSPIWHPAGQLQRQALITAFLRRHDGLEMHRILAAFPDGVEHRQAHRMLGWATPLRDPAVAWSVTLPALLSRGKAGSRVLATVDEDVATRATEMTLAGLERALGRERARLPAPVSSWAGYEHSRDHYTSDQLAAKRGMVHALVERIAPREILDLGANGGEFSAIAAGKAALLVAVDSDVDALRRAHAATAHLPMAHHALVDLAAPSPAMGWRGAECHAWDDRCEGRFDLVMALALLHHLALTGGIPLDEAVAWFARATRRHAIVEFIGPDDPRFAELATARGRDGTGLQRTDFEAAARRHFAVRQCAEIVPGRRWLYWLERT